MDLKRFKQLLESKLGDVKPLVTEETTTLPQTEDEFKKLLTDNGFVIPNEEETVKFFSPATFTMSKYNWVYINKETKGYSYKSENRITFGLKSIYIPKEDKTYPTEFQSITGFPVTENNRRFIEKYITNPPKFDKSYDFDSILRTLDNTRIWGPEPPEFPNGYIVQKNGKLYTAYNNQELQPTLKNTISNSVNTNLNLMKKVIEDLPQEEKTKPIVSPKSQQSFSNINDYMVKVETEAKDLGFIKNV